MRTKYCIRYELGLCPVKQKSDGTNGSAIPYTPSTSDTTVFNRKPPFPAPHLHLSNNGKRYPISFDCAHCEMVIRAND